MLQVGFGVAGGDSGAGELGRDDVVGLLPPVVEQHRHFAGDGLGLVGRHSGQQVVASRSDRRADRRARAAGAAP